MVESLLWNCCSDTTYVCKSFVINSGFRFRVCNKNIFYLGNFEACVK